MVKINKVYTKTGDKGETGLVGGRRVPKESLRVSAFGDVDELNSHIGLARTIAERLERTTLVEELSILQNELFDIGSVLATAPGDEWPGMIQISDDHITKLEQWIDNATLSVPELRSFVLPGGSELNSTLHIARAVCRRSERSVITLSRGESVPEKIIIYLNRLSDLLFAYARKESITAGTPEYLWKPGG